MAVSGGGGWAFQRALQEFNSNKPQRNSTTVIKNSIGGQRKVTKGRLGNVTFQVNPTTVEFGGGNNWTEIAYPSSNSHEYDAVPQLQFSSAKLNTFTFELYINEWMFGQKINAQEFVKEIYRCRGSKQTVKFALGDLVKNVVVMDCSVVAESFNPDMTMREVRMNVVLATVYL